MNNILEDLPRGSGVDKKANGPSAQFEPTENIGKVPSLAFDTKNIEGKLFLGVTDSAVESRRLSDGRLERYTTGGYPVGLPDDRHVVTIAGSRSGKGRSAIVPNLLCYPGSVLVIDPKGDLAKETAGWRSEKLKQKVLILDPFEVAGSNTNSLSAAFNPMSILVPESPTLVEDAGLIADSLIVMPPGSKDPHWEDAARQFLEGVILHVATCHSYTGQRSLVTVYHLISEDIDKLEDEMQENAVADFAVVAAAKGFFEKSEAERGSVLSTLRTHIRFLGYKSIQKSVDSHDFDLSELKRSNVTIYLSLPAMRMTTCSRWLRLFVNLTLAALEKEKVRPRYPILLCLDEFAVLGTMKTLENAAGQIAGLGCKLWPILQDLGQLKSLYQDRWETFMGNAGVLQFFGNSDMTTLEWISKRLGQCTISSFSRNTPSISQQTSEGATGESFSQQVHDLMTPEEVSRFFGRDDKLLRSLIIRPSFKPMILQRAFYDKHPLFQDYQNYIQQ